MAGENIPQSNQNDYDKTYNPNLEGRNLKNPNFSDDKILINQYLELRRGELSLEDIQDIFQYLEKKKTIAYLNKLLKETKLSLDDRLQIKELKEVIKNEKFNFQVNSCKLTVKELAGVKMERKEGKIFGKKVSADLPVNIYKTLKYSLNPYKPSIMKNGLIILNFLRGRNQKQIKIKYIIKGNKLIFGKDINRNGKIEQYSETTYKTIPNISRYKSYTYLNVDIAKILGKKYKKCSIKLKIEEKRNNSANRHEHHNY